MKMTHPDINEWLIRKAWNMQTDNDFFTYRMVMKSVDYLHEIA